MTSFTTHAAGYEAGDIIDERFRITGTLGVGGYGAVYAAEQLSTGRPIALKLLISRGDISSFNATRRFRREVRLMAQLSSLHTVQIIGAGQQPNGPRCLAMELLRGKTLAALLRERFDEGRGLSDMEMVSLATGVLRSLAEAHQLGLVHRDLKPANLMLASVGDNRTVVKVLDFGIAMASGVSLTQTGQTIGTPLYMSPEQFGTGAVGPASDLYSLAVILYLCATRELPYASISPVAVAQMHCDDPIPDPREKSSCSDELAEIIMTAMAKQPDERFADARAMREAFEAIRARSGACEIDWDCVVDNSAFAKTTQMLPPVTADAPTRVVSPPSFAARAAPAQEPAPAPLAEGDSSLAATSQQPAARSISGAHQPDDVAASAPPVRLRALGTRRPACLVARGRARRWNLTPHSAPSSWWIPTRAP